MKKQIGYKVVEASRAFMISDLIKKVKDLQKDGWVCQGSILIDDSSGESWCYQAMVMYNE